MKQVPHSLPTILQCPVNLTVISCFVLGESLIDIFIRKENTDMRLTLVQPVLIVQFIAVRFVLIVTHPGHQIGNNEMGGVHAARIGQKRGVYKPSLWNFEGK